MKEAQVDTQALAELCRKTRPAAGAARLVQAIDDATPGLHFRLALLDDGWYRLGGVVTADGRRVADDLEEWVTAESGGDVIELMAGHGDSGLIATSIKGRSLYLVAPTGNGPMDFIQLEVEELQEVTDRELFRADWIPDTLEDVIDPMEYPRLDPRPLAPPRYEFRRITFFAEKAGDLTSEYSGDPRFRRFLEEWRGSSATSSTRFCDQWVLTIIPYLDSTGTHMNEVKPLCTSAKALTVIRTAKPESGPGLAELTRAVDLAAGYPMAWYFTMINRNYLPYKLVREIQRGLSSASGGYGYYPARDVKILEHWVEEPYHL